MAKRYEFSDSKPGPVHPEAGQKCRARGHRARLCGGAQDVRGNSHVGALHCSRELADPEKDTPRGV